MNTPHRPAAPRRVSGDGRAPQASSVVEAPRDRGPHSATPPPIRTPISWRAVVLVVVFALAVAVVLPSLRAYGRQDARLTELTAQVEAARAEVADLEAELARWEDPEYVIGQARERLFYVMPGETAYRVVDPETVPSDSAPEDDLDTLPIRMPDPWYLELWGSFVNASPAPEAP